MAKNEKRPGLGVNPLDVLMGGAPAVAPAAEAPVKSRPEPVKKPVVRESAVPEPSDNRVEKIRTTYHLPKALVENLRNAAMHLAGPPEYLTLSDIVENALNKELERLQKKHNESKPFPMRPRNLRGGRPTKS